MCNRYFQPPRERISLHRLLAIPPGYVSGDVYPRGTGAFVRRADKTEALEIVLGQWALIPPFAQTRVLTYSTHNARSEGVATVASFKHAWANSQRCLVFAESFWEPCWESGKNEWWRFQRTDGAPWRLAGLWNRWVDRVTGEIVESYTLLTQNADAHPLMRRMHKPDPQLGPDAQDKRSVVAIEINDTLTWLTGTPEQVRPLVRLTPAEAFIASPERDTHAHSSIGSLF